MTTNRRLFSTCNQDFNRTYDQQTELKSISIDRPSKYVVSVQLYSPKRKNAFSLETAQELIDTFRILEDDKTVRCVILSGNGTDFTSGVDVKSFMSVYQQIQETNDIAHRAKLLLKCIEQFQAPFKSIYSFSKPTICVQHGLSLGLAMELAACCDIRYCSSDTKMAIREVLIGIAADVGSLQLMPRLASNQSLLHELIYTGRYMTTTEALELGFVSRILETKDAAMEVALETAMTIAKRSPVAIYGSKRNLQFSRNKPFLVGLDYNAIWNSAMMQGEDVIKAIGAIISKQNDDDIEYDDF